MALKGSNYNGITEKQRGLKWKVESCLLFCFLNAVTVINLLQVFLWLAKMGLGGWEFKLDIRDLDDISSEKVSKKTILNFCLYSQKLSFWLRLFFFGRY